MSAIIREKDNRELVISSITNITTDFELTYKPTVCLIVLNESYEKNEILSIIKKVINDGVVFFLIQSKLSDELEDLIDEFIESSIEKDLTHMVTASTEDQDIDDIAWFFINATYFDEGAYRYLVLYDTTTPKWKVLQNKIINCF